MSAYSTKYITKLEASAKIISAIMEASDYQLENVLNDLVGEPILIRFKIDDMQAEWDRKREEEEEEDTY